MKRVIKPTNDNNITVDDLIDQLNCKIDIVVFYYTGSTVRYPVFFKKINYSEYGFVSPIFNYKPVYTGDLYTSIRTAARAKDLYVVDKADIDKIFKKAK